MTVYWWNNEFKVVNGKLRPMRSGTPERKGLMSQDDARLRCEEFVGLHADTQGGPNLTAHDFREFLHREIIPCFHETPECRSILEAAQIQGEITLRGARALLREMISNHTSVRNAGYCDS